MTDQTALRVANAVCDVRRQAAAQLIAYGIEPERVAFTTPGDGLSACGLEVDGVLACLVSWIEKQETVEIELTWADAWCHLAAVA